MRGRESAAGAVDGPGSCLVATGSRCRLRIVLGLLLTLGAAASLTGQTVSLQDTADTVIKADNPNKNFGAQPSLVLREGGNRVLVRFDPAAIAAAVGGGSLASAQLQLYVSANGGNWGPTGRTVDAYRVDSAWPESGATWNCAADATPANDVADCAAPWHGGALEAEATDSIVLTNTSSGWIQFDVTADVQAFLAGTANDGWLIQKTDEGQAGRVTLASKEAAGGLGPRLVLLSESAAVDTVPPSLAIVAPALPVVVNVPSPQIAVAYHDGGSGVDASTLHILLDGQDLTAGCTVGAESANCVPPPLAAGAHAVSANLRDRAGNAATAARSFQLLIGPSVHTLSFPVAGDTYIAGGAPNREHGRAAILRVAKSGPSRALVQFDPAPIAAALATSQLASAQLELSIAANGNNWGASGRAVGAYLAAAAWSEGAATWSCPADANLDNDTPDCAAPWNGGAFASSPTATALLTRKLAGAIAFDVTSDVAALLAGTTAQASWLLKKTDETASGRVDFVSREASSGQAAQLVVVFQVPSSDTTPPVVTVTSPVDGSLLATAAPTIAATFSDLGSGVDVTSVRLVVDGVDDTAAAQVTAAGISFTPAQPVADGAHAVTLTVRDRAGNQAQAQWAFTTDTAPPAIAAVAPMSGSLLNNPLPTVSAAFGDAGSGVAAATVRLLVDGVDQTGNAQVTATGLVLVLGSRLSDGGHSLALTLADRAGNTAQTSWSFTTDTAAPALTVTAPSTPVVTKQPQPQIALAYADGLSGVDTSTLQVTLDSTDLTPTCVIGPASASCAPGSPLAEGQHRVSSTVQDLAGNSATASFSFQLVLDTEPPAVTLTSPLDGALFAASPIQVRGTATDDGIVSSVSVNGQPAAFAGGAFSATVTLAEGSNPILAVATDASGKQGSAAATAILDTQPPTLTLDAPKPGQLTNQATIRVAGSAADANGIASVSVAGQAAALAGGRFDVQVPVVEGPNQIAVQAVDLAGNPAALGVAVVRYSLPAVAITAPPDLSVLSATTVTVSGTVDQDVAAVTVNGVPATVSGTTFAAIDVPLLEGGNTLTATAVNALGHVSSASVNVVRDLTPPRVAIYLPADGAVVHDGAVSVSGLVNDIVNGTVNASQAAVTVNGRPASVANRSFLATDVPLAAGDNVLTVTAVDAAGNSGQASITVHRLPAAGPRIAMVSGDHQSAVIGAALAQPLVAVLLDAAGQPMAGMQVLFRAAGNNGSLDGGKRQIAVTTDANGQARAHFTLGTHAGVANQSVEAAAVGFGIEGPVTFTATALAGAPALIVVDAGDQQLGVAGQPLPRPLVAAVVDQGSNRLAGVSATFRVVKGAGHFANGQAAITAVSDSDGRLIVPFTTDPDEGISNNTVTAGIDGLAGGAPAIFTSTGWAGGDPSQTAVSGIVLDNSNVPVAGVSLRLRDTNITAQTDAQGRFRIFPAPVGDVKLIVDGSTAQRPGAWPDLEYELITVPGRDNSLGMPIYLLPLDLSRSAVVDETHGARLTLADVPGFALDVQPGAVTFPGGGRAGTVSVTLVHSDKVPMVPNFGQQPRLIVTIQPAGARFDPPAVLTMPNVEGFAPGEVTEFYSFDHDLGHFVSIGPATVSDDGSVVVSNRGVGVLKAGWHCNGNPATAGAAHNCPTCRKCSDGDCVADDGQVPPQASPTDCVTQVCKGGSVSPVPDDHEIPPQNPDNNCTKQVCKGGRAVTVPDPFFGHARQVPGNCLREICNPDGPGTVVDLNDAPPGKACCGQPFPSTATPSIYDPGSQCCSPSSQVVPKGPPISSLADCPNRVAPATPPPHLYDGCSLPDAVVSLLKKLFPDTFSGNPNNPAGAPDTYFSNFGQQGVNLNAPCDKHDECYQTCASDSARDACDAGLGLSMINTCLATKYGDKIRTNCLEMAALYYTGVNKGGGSAFNGDQLKWCQCCP